MEIPLGMLLGLGFAAKWVETIMLCVTTIRYNIWIDGLLIGPITPS